MVEWAAKGRVLLARDRLNVANAMAWQRDTQSRSTSVAQSHWQA